MPNFRSQFQHDTEAFERFAKALDRAVDVLIQETEPGSEARAQAGEVMARMRHCYNVVANANTLAHLENERNERIEELRARINDGTATRDERTQYVTLTEASNK